MMTATLATVLSALRGSSCSLDVNKPYITYEVGAIVPIDSTSSGSNAAVLSADASHPNKNPSVPAKVISPHGSNHQREILEPGQKHTSVASTGELHARIESLEVRCDWYKRELQKLAREMARSKLESAKSCKSSDTRNVNAAGVSSEPDSHTAASIKQEQRKLVRPAGSSPLPKKTNGRQRRPLNLDISGTAKLKFGPYKGGIARPKLVRGPHGWHSYGRRRAVADD
jgi:hypothetical protein